MNRNHDVITFTSIYFTSIKFCLRKLRVSIFADIIKIVFIFIEAIFEDSKMLKEIEIKSIKVQFIFAFLDKAKLLNFQ